jgi:hypothetical protein
MTYYLTQPPVEASSQPKAAKVRLWSESLAGPLDIREALACSREEREHPVKALLSEITRKELEKAGLTSVKQKSHYMGTKEAQANWLVAARSLIGLAVETLKALHQCYISALHQQLLVLLFDLFKISIYQLASGEVCASVNEQEFFNEPGLDLKVKQMSDLVRFVDSQCPLLSIFQQVRKAFSG